VIREEWGYGGGEEGCRCKRYGMAMKHRLEGMVVNGAGGGGGRGVRRG
jgi:hypothetical protein